MSFARAFAFVPVALLCGCATNAYKAKVPSVSAADCTEQLGAIPAVALQPSIVDPEKAPTYVEFADIAHCYRATDKAVPVALYAFKSASPPAELEVSVSLSTGGTFAAALELLDAQFRSLRRYGFESFVRRGNEYRLTAFLNSDAAMPAYAMLLPDPGQVGKSDTTLGSVSNPMMVPAGPVMFAVQNGYESRVTRPFLEGGRISVELHPQDAAPFVPKQ